MKILLPNTQKIFRIAAETFAFYWEKITGTTPEIVTEPDPADTMIVLGSDAENAYVRTLIEEDKLPPHGLRIGSDEYRILSLNENGRDLLILMGGSKRAILYAVYDYFERFGNCAYFWDGDRIPQAETLPLSGIDVLERPRFQYRGLRYFAHRSLTRFQAEQWDFPDWQKELDWCLKKRFDFFMLRIGIDDLFQRAFPDIVPYPERDVMRSENAPRTYDDRTLFWSLEYRGELRKKILAYARERGLISPEDCGTMTHWYSRTPKEFLDTVKPTFVPQTTECYGEPTGLVWDIRLDKYMDYYWKLTETSIREYGSPEMFHTIGLAERGCYADPAKNHEMKLFAYRRIQAKLREHYPNAPLLIGTWDFVYRWDPPMVQALLHEMNPENTIIFDYISDTYDEINNFTNWGVMHKFPYFFGIFHAYESSTDIRGNYTVIERRLPKAAADPMCKGMVAWPENSHADTLMLEYLAANSWDPSPENIKTESFLEKFIAKRCAAPQGDILADAWRTLFPLIRTHYWRTRADERWRDIYPDQIFTPIGSWMYFTDGVDCQENYIYQTNEMAPYIDRAPETFRKLSTLDFNGIDPMLFRDALDLARTAALRMSNFAGFRTQVLLDRWKKHTEGIESSTLLDCIAAHGDLIRKLTDLLAAHEDYSLYDSLERLKKCQPTNPYFEHTLKANGENNYCRSFIHELFKGSCIPEYEALEAEMRKRILADDRSFGPQPQSLRDIREEIRKNYYETPLKDLTADHAAATAALPDTLRALAEISKKLIGHLKTI